MAKSETSTKTATVIIFFELIFGIIVHIFGLILLFTSQSITISNLLLIKLSFVEISYILHEGITNAHSFIKNGHLEPPNDVGRTMIIFLHSLRIMVLMAITVDRILAVRLALRYKTVVTRRKLVIVVICIWLTSSCLALIMWYSHASILNTLLAIEKSVLVVVYICGYVYIILRLKAIEKKFPNHKSTRHLSIKVPFLLVLSLICFFWIPELILAAGFDYSIWFLVLFYMTNIVDALIYIFGLPECQRRLKKVCFGPKTEPCGTPQQHHVGQVMAESVCHAAVVCGGEENADNSSQN